MNSMMLDFDDSGEDDDCVKVENATSRRKRPRSIQ